MQNFMPATVRRGHSLRHLFTAERGNALIGQL